MKLIKKGEVKPKDLSFPDWAIGMQRECWKCKSVVEIENGDQFSPMSDDYGRSRDFLCPSCKDWMYVYRPNTPEEDAEEAREDQQEKDKRVAAETLSTILLKNEPWTQNETAIVSQYLVKALLKLGEKLK